MVAKLLLTSMVVVAFQGFSAEAPPLHRALAKPRPHALQLHHLPWGVGKARAVQGGGGGHLHSRLLSTTPPRSPALVEDWMWLLG